MHGALKRQLFLACCGIGSLWAAPAGTDLNSELRAIDALQASLSAEALSFDDPEIKKLASRYQQLVEKYEETGAAHAARAQFLASFGQFAQAKKEWETAQRLESANAGYAHQFANCCLSVGDVNAAVAALEKAVQLQPASALYHHDLGNAYFLFRHKLRPKTGSAVLSEALRHLRKAAQLDRSNLEFARGYAETFYGVPDPDWDAALKAWEHVLQLSDDKQLAYSNMVRVQIQLGRLGEARRTLEKLPAQSKMRSVLQRQIDSAAAGKPSAK